MNKTKSLGLGLAGLVAVAWAMPSSAQVAGQWRDGRHLYDKICAYCHESGVGPVLWGRELQPDYVKAKTRHGSNGMPAFRFTEIDDATLAKLAELIAASSPPKPAGGKP